MRRFFKIIKENFTVTYKTLLMTICIVLIMLSLLIVSFQSYYSTKNFILNKMKSINTSNLYQSRQKLDNNLMRIENVVKSISEDTMFLEDLNKYKMGTSGEMATIQSDINSFLAKLKSFNNYIDGICVFTEKPILYSGNYEGMSMLHDIKTAGLDAMVTNSENIEKRTSILLYEPGDIKNISDKNSSIELNKRHFFYCEIHKNSQSFAKIIVLINPTIFSTLLSGNKNLILINKNGNTIWSGGNIDSNLVDELSTNEIMSYLSTSSAYNGLKLIYYQDSKEINKYFWKLKIFLAIIFFITSLFAIYFSGKISESINKSVKSLLITVEKYKFEFSHKEQLWVEEKKKITLRERIFFYLSAMIILPVIIFAFILYFYSSNTIKEYIVRSNYNTFVQTSENIDYFFDNKINVIRNMVYNETLQEILRDEKKYEKFILMKQSEKSLIDDKLILGEGRDEVFIYNKDKEIILSNSLKTSNTISYIDMIKYIDSSDDTYFWNPTQKDLYNRYLINLLVKIRDLKTLETIGYLQSQIPESYLENIYKTLVQGEEDIFLVDKDNTIISHFDKNRIGEKFLNINDRKAYVFECNISNTNWKLIRYNTFESYNIETKKMFLDKIYLLAFITSSMTIICFILSFILTNNINKLSKILKDINIEGIGLIFPENTYVYEVNKLGIAFNEMVIRIETLIDQLLISTKKQSILESKKKEAELIALQAQINPHFLYNTFESINWMIKSDDKLNAIGMLNDLSNLLRYYAKSNEPLVTIKEEIMHVKAYSDIMKMRFKENLSFKWEISEDTLEYKIIKFTLQPLIENAIYHGIMPKQNKGTILVKCYSENNELENNESKNNGVIIIIHDDGAGIDELALKKIKEELSGQNLNIGLYNVQNRIKILFGDGYGLAVKSVLGKETEVKVHIPKYI